MSNLIKLGSLPAKQTAFFLCDMQEKFRPMISHFDKILYNTKRLALLSKICELPLIVTEQYPSGLGHTVEDIDTKHAVGVFSKTKFSMCIPEVLAEIDKMKDLQCVVLFGIEAHACIEQTAMDLRERNLAVHVVADACSSRSLEDRKWALERMKKIGCFLTTVETVAMKLVPSKDHPKFDEIRTSLWE